jgi:hypothetical protein
MPETLRGQHVQCQSCRTTFLVGPAPPGRAASSALLFLGLPAAVGLVLLGGGLIAWSLLRTPPAATAGTPDRTNPEPVAHPSTFAEPLVQLTAPHPEQTPIKQPKVNPVPKDATVAVPFMADVIFPSAPSRFVAIGRGARDPSYDVWDLETVQQVGGFRRGNKARPGEPAVLSPDGRRLAVISEGGVRLWIRDNSKAQSRLVPSGPTEWTDFATGDRLLVAARGSGHVDFWDLVGGKLLGKLPVANTVNVRATAIAPGGRFVALADRAAVDVRELLAGGNVKSLPLPGPRGAFALEARKLAFSPDGSELAGLFFDQPRSWRLVCWDLRRSGQPVDLALGEDLGLKGEASYKGAPLEWLPDRSGWLLYGQVVVDRAGKHQVAFPVDIRTRPVLCHILTGDYAARVVPRGGVQGSEVRFVPLPRP